MIEKTILKNLILNEDYSRRVLPYLKEEYFQAEDDRVLYSEVRDFILKYNTMPTFDALEIEIDSLGGLREETVKEISAKLINYKNEEYTKPDLAWLMETTEKFCRDRALYLAITKSIEIMGGSTNNLSVGAIPTLLSDALAVTFNPNVGHDFFGDYASRYEYYHSILDRLSFDLKYFNRITNGGLPAKTLSVALAGTGVGKSLFMCHCAAANLSLGKNVLYITLELSEKEVSKRIEANLLNIPINDLMQLPKPIYEQKLQALRKKTDGNLIVQEYPTASANVLHFKSLLEELKIKKNFIPDIIYIDYLNICTSSRLKHGNGVNSYTYIKSIAEELRGLAVEYNLPIVSATQTNRSGFTSSDVGLEDTSESFGLPATVDFMFALIATEELTMLNQILVKQLKNRFRDENLDRKFVLGIDKSKMRLYDVEDSAQQGISGSGNVSISSASSNTRKLNIAGSGIKL